MMESQDHAGNLGFLGLRELAELAVACREVVVCF